MSLIDGLRTVARSGWVSNSSRFSLPPSPLPNACTAVAALCVPPRDGHHQGRRGRSRSASHESAARAYRPSPRRLPVRDGCGSASAGGTPRRPGRPWQDRLPRGHRQPLGRDRAWSGRRRGPLRRVKAVMTRSRWVYVLCAKDFTDCFGEICVTVGLVRPRGREETAR
jgi:hypothetical protein